MNVYLARTLLLSLGISIFITLVFIALEKEMKLPQIIRFQQKKDTYKAAFTVIAPGYPSASEQQREFARSIKQNISITQERLEAADFDYKLQPLTDSSYLVSVSDISDSTSIHDLLVANSRLSFHEVYTLLELVPPLTELSNRWPSIAKRMFADSVIQAWDSANLASLFSFFLPATAYDNLDGGTRYPPYIGMSPVKWKPVLHRLLTDKEVLNLFPADALILFGDANDLPRETTEYFYVYAVRNNPEVTNKYIKTATPEIGMYKTPEILFKFDAAGSMRWEAMTRRNVGKPIAICLNDKVVTAPNVISAITGGISRITMGGNSNMEQCRTLSVLLTSEELTIPVQINESHITANHNFSRSLLIPYLDYLLLFLLSFSLSFCLTWFVFKPGKKAAARP